VVSAEQRQEFDERLDGARRRLDASVAAIMSPDPQRFASLIRGGQPTAAEWKAARQAAERATAGAVTDERLRAILAEVLSDVTAEPDMVIVEIDDHGITIARVRLDGFGSPLLHRPEPTLAWQHMLPLLAKHADERRFQLAGGFGSADRDELWTTLSKAVPKIGDDRVTVICRPPGWQVLDRAAELISRQAAASRLVRAVPAADSSSLAALIDGEVATAPLRPGYGLMGPVADPVTKEVHTQVRPLFAPGDRPGREVSVAARRVPGDRGDVTLAILVDGNGATQRQEQPMVVAAAIPQEPDYRISVALDGPGRIRITEPAGTRPQERPWLEILAEVPHQLDALIGPFDLVCAIDLAGTKAEVRERRGLVGELLTLLEGEYPQAEMLRVSVLGCTDHVFSPRSDRTNVVRGAPLAPVGEARAMLTGLTGADVVYPDAAPIEDLLHKTAGLLSDSHRQGRQARLLLVGQRTPHPRAQGPNTPIPCPFRYDWRAALRTLTDSCAVACVAVTDKAPSRDQARVWRELGKTMLCHRDATDARQLSDYLGILPANSPRIPIPLAISN